MDVFATCDTASYRANRPCHLGLHVHSGSDSEGDHLQLDVNRPVAGPRHPHHHRKIDGTAVGHLECSSSIGDSEGWAIADTADTVCSFQSHASRSGRWSYPAATPAVPPAVLPPQLSVQQQGGRSLIDMDAWAPCYTLDGHGGRWGGEQGLT